MSDIPRDMRVAVLRGVRDLVLQERQVPTPGPQHVLVRVASVGTCGSDVHYYEEGRIGDFVVESPLVLGHEPSGVVVATGSEVSGARVGQRVAIEPGVPDFTCAQCRAGRYNLCPNMVFFGTPPVDGAFAEYVLVHQALAYPIPDELSDDAAGLLEPLSVGVWSNQKAGVAPGSRVLITGAGPIGLIALQTARAFGATEVVVTDVRQHRLAVADELGATAAVDVSKQPLAELDFEPEVLIECSGVQKATSEAIRAVAPAGRVVLVGMGGAEIALPLDHVQRREIQVTGTFRYANTWPTAIALARSGEVLLDRLVTHQFGLAAVEDALTAAAQDESTIKAVVHPRE